LNGIKSKFDLQP